MSSIASPVSSLDSSSSAPIYFSGMSSYSSSLNNEISQEVQLASLPIQILQNDVTTLSNQSSELQTLNTDFSSVQSAISGLASAAGSMLSASVSDPSVATATIGSTATAGTYTLQVTSLGSYSDALSVDGLTTVTDPTSQNISASSSFTLTVGSQNYTITPSSSDLNALAQAINESSADVQATVVNVGSSSAPDYRLSLQSEQLGDVSMQLNDGSQPLLEASGEPGQPAQYTIDGQQVQSNSDTVTLAPGLTVNLTGVTSGDDSTTITVAPDSSSIANALQTFVTVYNSAITDLGKNIGQSGGPLAGESIVYELTDSLQSLANYTSGSGNISSMAALGLTFNDTSGQLSFDQSTFDTATSGQTAALQQFLGSPTSGGFLETATNSLSGIEDPTDGILTQEINSVQSQITSTNSQISTEEDQVSQLQTNLTQEMSAADAQIYSMQQQASYFQSLFTAEQDNEVAASS
jgi:flagellar hook-associated protein 2